MIKLATALALIGGFLYWLLVTTEGAYLGPRIVARLYDRSASEYDEIKMFDREDDRWRIGEPLVDRLVGQPRPLVLDIATGAGRVPELLLRNPSFQGRIMALDISLGMLQEAWQKTRLWAERIDLVWEDGSALPFTEETFSAVVCLEALEFFPHPRQALQEMVRVLRPGGTLLITNRVGGDRLLFPGRAFARSQLSRYLSSLGLEAVTTERWQTYYDLVWARKSSSGGISSGRFPLRCPACGGFPLQRSSAHYACRSCGRLYPHRDGIIFLRERTSGAHRS